MNFMELFTIAIAGFLSVLIKNGVGIGLGIFLLPVLTLVFPAKIVLGIGAPIMLGSDIIGLRKYWKEWASTRELLWLLGPAVPGMLLGTWLIPVIPGHAFRMGVGLFGMAYAMGMLFLRSRIVSAFTRLLPRPHPGSERCNAVFYGMLGGRRRGHVRFAGMSMFHEEASAPLQLRSLRGVGAKFRAGSGRFLACHRLWMLCFHG